MAEEGLVPGIECPMDQGLLMPNQGNEDQIFLYCLSCEYKKEIGLDYYNKIVKLVDDISRKKI